MDFHLNNASNSQTLLVVLYFLLPASFLMIHQWKFLTQWLTPTHLTYLIYLSLLHMLYQTILLILTLVYSFLLHLTSLYNLSNLSSLSNLPNWHPENPLDLTKYLLTFRISIVNLPQPNPYPYLLHLSLLSPNFNMKHATSTVFGMFVKNLVALALFLKQYIKISLLPNFKTIMY